MFYRAEMDWGMQRICARQPSEVTLSEDVESHRKMLKVHGKDRNGKNIKM